MRTVAYSARQVVPIIEDPASDPRTFNEKANKLVVRDRVPSVFGSYTSASRKAVLPVFEKRKNLYWYPTFYEGFECSKNVIYTGAVPNQQQENFVPWITNQGYNKFFIVGSNYIYPREMAKVCKILVEREGGSWVADEYLELGHSRMGFDGQQDEDHVGKPASATASTPTWSAIRSSPLDVSSSTRA